MLRSITALSALLIACGTIANAQPEQNKNTDHRHQPLKDLNGYFPFQPPTSLEQWDTRKNYVRRQILVSQGLWPMPAKTPLNPVIHGRIEREGYTIEKVYFQSAPGLFVTGNLYRPTQPKGKVPAVMLAHGHWQDARLSLHEEAKVRRDISTGAERFTRGGQSIHQSLCVQLARMGCVVWQWDMLSDSDAIQFSREVVHGFAKQRAEMNTSKNWGLYSTQAESHLQSIMGLQTLNAIRGLDFVLTLPEVDPKRIAVTGGSGGGTQAMILAAIDDRVALSFPCVMVSTSMQGGCTCENATLLRVDTGNVEFAALFAPKPQGMNTADDWTREMSTKGFPELQKLYELYGKKNHVLLHRGEHFPHNYNAVTRSAVYSFLNTHFKLGYDNPIIEKDFEPLTADQLTVWNQEHPAPKANDLEFEKSLLNWWQKDAQQQLQKPEALQKTIAPALEILIARNYANAGEVTWDLQEKLDRDSYLEMQGTLTNKTHQETIQTTWLYPKSGSDRAVIWLDDHGRADLRDEQQKLLPAVQKLLDQGIIVVGADLLFQNQPDLNQANRSVKGPREVPAYSYGYNPTLFAQRTHDILTLVQFLRHSKVGNHPNPKTIDIVANGQTGPIALAARALTGDAVQQLVAETNGFRFASLLDYKHPMFLPGASKYLDLPGLASLNAPQPLLLIGETEAKDLPEQSSLTKLPAEANRDEAILKWLSSKTL